MITLTLLLCLGQVDEPQAPPPGPSGPEAIVERIRENLGRIDVALFESSESERVLDDLADVRETHLDVIRDLEELIRQAKYQSSGQSGGGGGGGGGGGESSSQSRPPPRESDGSQTGRSESESQPRSGEGEEAEDGSQSRPEESAARDGGAGGNEDARTPPPPDPVSDFTREDTDGRWGLLPPKLQERLMNLHVDDVPERYRAWVTAYIRSLNRHEQESSR